MSQATPTKFFMLLEQNYGKLFWKFGDHSFNFSYVHGPSWLRVSKSIHRYGVIFTFWKKKFKRSLWGHAWCQKNTLLTFKGICMNFLLKINNFILSHPVTSKQPDTYLWDTLYLHVFMSTSIKKSWAVSIMAMIWVTDYQAFKMYKF
jgi:hypothetical protein